MRRDICPAMSGHVYLPELWWWHGWVDLPHAAISGWACLKYSADISKISSCILGRLLTCPLDLLPEWYHQERSCADSPLAVFLASASTLSFSVIPSCPSVHLTFILQPTCCHWVLLPGCALGLSDGIWMHFLLLVAWVAAWAVTPKTACIHFIPSLTSSGWYTRLTSSTSNMLCFQFPCLDVTSILFSSLFVQHCCCPHSPPVSKTPSPLHLAHLPPETAPSFNWMCMGKAWFPLQAMPAGQYVLNLSQLHIVPCATPHARGFCAS